MASSSFSHAEMFQRKQQDIFVESDDHYNKRWISLYKNKEDGLLHLIRLLRRSARGKVLIEQAKKRAAEQGLTLLEVIFPGRSSVTDTTLVRRFKASRPEELTFVVESRVYINQELTVMDAILDLAHELIHYVYRDPFNPYEGKFALKDFIMSTISGRGGEVDAFLVECQVFRDLFPRYIDQKSRCRKIQNENGMFSRNKGKQLFFRLGNYFKKFKNRIQGHRLHKKDLPLATDLGEEFISSAYGLPYPLAAVLEYETIMERACENDEKRLAFMDEQVKLMEISRLPATERKSTYNQLLSVFEKRCHRYLSSLKNAATGR